MKVIKFMGMTNKKLKKHRKEVAKQKKIQKKKQGVNEEILSSISDPNPWTPEKEDEWLRQPSNVLRDRFPPMTKPTHVRYRHTGPGLEE